MIKRFLAAVWLAFLAVTASFAGLPAVPEVSEASYSVDAEMPAGVSDLFLPEARGPPILLAQETPVPGPVQGFYSAGGGGDPYWAFVTYLVGNNNASNGTTTFLDQSTNGLSTTRGGNTVWSSAVQFSGQNTILFDGSGDYLRVATNAAFAFGTGDWAVDGMFRVTNISSTRILYFLYDGSTDTDMSVESDGSLCIWVLDNGVCSSASAIAINTTYHYAASKCSGTVRIFINGTQAGSIADSRNYGTSRNMTLGATDSVAGEFVGNHGYFRVTKGSCRGYNASFTAPTPPVPNS